MDGHDEIRRVEEHAFALCSSLKWIVLRGARSIDYSAFYFCNQLLYVELGAELETIGESAFDQCTSLREVDMPSVIRIGFRAFQGTDLTELDLPEGLEAVEGYAFAGCKSLTRVSMPLKEGLIQDGVFVDCPRLARIDLIGIGEILEIVSSLHLELWRNAIKVEINQINQVLLGGRGADKTKLVQEWMQSVIQSINHYKEQHVTLLKEIEVILELCLWKLKLEGAIDGDGRLIENRMTWRQEQRAICSADVVIRNVIPFLMHKI